MGAGNKFLGVLLTIATLLMGCSIDATHGIDFFERSNSEVGPTTLSWCVANPAADLEALQAALDYACGVNPDFCKPIQPNEPCYVPDTVEAHASFAFNSYWQALRGADSNITCDFNGTALIAITDPNYDPLCRYVDPVPQERPPASKVWCVAKPSAYRTLLQTWLDSACEHDPRSCEAIQRADQPCFQPNTVAAHASFAYNLHFQTPLF